MNRSRKSSVKVKKLVKRSRKCNENVKKKWWYDTF